MNREFIVQLIRNLSLYEDYLFHIKDKDLQKVQEFGSFLEKSINKFPKKESTVESKFKQMEEALKVICPIEHEWVFLLTDKSLSEEETMISTTLTKKDTGEMLLKLIEKSLE